MQKKNILQSVLVILTFLLAVYGNRLLEGFLKISFENEYLRVIWYYLWWIVPTILVTGFLFGFQNFFREMGLSRGFKTGLLVAGIAIIPMFTGSAIMGKIPEELTIWDLIISSLLPGFLEEYLFRAFLFGLLFRKMGWGFIPASVLGALIFGMGHVYQGTFLGQSAGIFLVTALGAAWYAWLMTEWEHNLWVPAFLHTLMNLSWVLFEVEANALGGWSSNIFRVLTIALATFITIHHNKKRGIIIRRENLWKNG